MSRSWKLASTIAAFSLLSIACTPTTPTNPSGPLVAGDVVLVGGVTVVPESVTRDFTFSYTIKNVSDHEGCVPTPLVVLRRTTPSNLVSKEEAESVCLAPGAVAEVTVKTPVLAGHWLASAQWVDADGAEGPYASPLAESPFDSVGSPVGTDAVRPSQRLLPNDELLSLGGQYRLAMQSDGNVVVYAGQRNEQVVWTTNTAGNPGAWIEMTQGGNVILHAPDSGATIWQTNSGQAGSRFVIQPDGNVVVRSAADAPVWASYSFWNALGSNQELRPDHYLSASNVGNITLHMQSDGNLVLYKNGPAVWASNTAGNPGAWLAMQSDGNLVIYSAAGPALWYTRTDGNSGSHMRLEADGNLVVYAPSGSVLWSSGTGAPPVTPGLALPWPGGSARSLGSFGLHSFDGLASPQSSLDFMGSGAITAVADGVVRTYSCSGLVTVNHGGGLYSSYYHLTSIAVTNGQSVTRGQILGQAGTNTGCGGTASGNHVHFTMYSTSATLDPFNNAHETSLVGRGFGGWVVQSNGCLRRDSDGLTRCANQQIPN